MAKALPALLVLAVALAGCSHGEDDDQGTPAPTPSETGNVTGVTISPPKEASGGKSEVCWRVQGDGTVPHVAIHWDTETHATKTDRTFADYDAGAAYPGNTEGLDPKGYRLPDQFCAKVDVPSSGSLYIVGHAIGKAGAPGRLSSETVLTAGSSQPIVGTAQAPEITMAPESAPAGSDATVCWRITGAGNVPHVAIHWDDQSHATAPSRSFTMYDMGASYPGNETAASPAGYNLQATGTTFCTAAKMPDSGTIYVVAHVIDSAGAPGKLSAEREIRVGGGTTTTTLRIEDFAYIPATLEVAAGATVSVKNEDATPHTATGISFDSGDIGAGATGSFTAPTESGEHPINCAYHTGMKGSLHVA